MNDKQWPYVFEAEIIKEGNVNGAYVIFPEDTFPLFGKKGHIKVKVVFDNRVSYRGSLASMGNGLHFLGVTMTIRKELGKKPGDSITVSIEPDNEVRTVEIPEDMESILREFPEAAETFNAMSYSHKREYVYWINGAKKTETRNRRLEKLIVLLLNKFDEKSKKRNKN